MTAAVEPLSTAGSSEYTISQATDSLRRVTLSAGFDDLNVRFNNVPDGRRAYWVVRLNVCLIMSVDNQPKKGQSNEKSGGL